MRKTGQTKQCQGLEKLGRHVAAMRNDFLERDLIMPKALTFLFLFSQLSTG